MFTDNSNIIPKGRPYSCEIKQEHGIFNVVIRINNIDKTREPSFAKIMSDSFKPFEIPIYIRCENCSEHFFINDINRVLNTMTITFQMSNNHDHKQICDILMKENWKIFYKTYINDEGKEYKIKSLSISDYRVF